MGCSKSSYIYFLFIWLGWVLVVAPGIFNILCGMWDIYFFSCGMWDLVLWPGIELGLPALGVWSLRHWITWEVPQSAFNWNKRASCLNWPCMYGDIFSYHNWGRGCSWWCYTPLWRVEAETLPGQLWRTEQFMAVKTLPVPWGLVKPLLATNLFQLKADWGTCLVIQGATTKIWCSQINKYVIFKREIEKLKWTGTT